MNLLLTVMMLLTQPQDLPAAYYQLPLEVREKATVVATGTYGQGRGPCIFRPDGTRVWALITWFRIDTVYQGKVGSKQINVYPDKSSPNEYVSKDLVHDRKYLVLLRPNEESQKALETGKYFPVWYSLTDDEIVAIVELK
jgi:hypothetical protein